MMHYKFDLTRLTIQDYIDLQNMNAVKVVAIASKCSLDDVHEIPITELAAFIETFCMGYALYVTSQFSGVK